MLLVVLTMRISVSRWMKNCKDMKNYTIPLSNYDMWEIINARFKEQGGTGFAGYPVFKDDEGHTHHCAIGAVCEEVGLESTNYKNWTKVSPDFGCVWSTHDRAIVSARTQELKGIVEIRFNQNITLERAEIDTEAYRYVMSQIKKRLKIEDI